MVKITVLKVLVKLNPEDSSYEDLLMAEAKRLVEAGERMIAEVPEVMWEKKGKWWQKDQEGIAQCREIVQVHCDNMFALWTNQIHAIMTNCTVWGKICPYKNMR